MVLLCGESNSRATIQLLEIMLRFNVYNNEGPADDWPLENAHLLGPDDVAVAGRVSFTEGRIICKPRGSGAVALALLYDAGAAGRLLLQTCLLPDREQPYLLAQELARHRIKSFIVKSEEWQMFDIDANHPAMVMWEQARQLFTKSMLAGDIKEADRYARRSLIRGIEASESLAMTHADILLHRRFSNRAASSVTLGVGINPKREGKALRDLISREFDIVVIPLCWRDLEVQEGRYQWDATDRWMDWAHRVGKPIVAGPLIDFSKSSIPQWMYVWQHDYDTTRDMVYDHIQRVIQRYHGVVGMWNVAAGVNVNDNYEFTPAQMIDLVRMGTLAVRHARKGARTMIELTQPFGEFGSINHNAMPPVTFIERLLHDGIRMDAVGLQLLFGQPTFGRVSRDLMQFSNLLDRFFLIDRPVLLSAFGVPAVETDGAGGWWREPWSPETQARWTSQAFSIAMSKPFVESVFWCDLIDHVNAKLPVSGLIDTDGRPRPVLQKLLAARRRLRKPLGPLKQHYLVDTRATS